MTLVDPVRNRLTVGMIVIANAVPLAGVLLFGWGIFPVAFLYWLESAVVGAYNAAKLVRKNPLKSTYLVPVFLLHFGFFMFVHLGFLYKLFAPADLHNSSFPSQQVLVSQMFMVWPALASLVISHGISFIKNFLGKREYENLNLEELMFAPYRRIIVMQAVVILGGGIMTTLNVPMMLGLVFLIAFKTAADVDAHIRERR